MTFASVKSCTQNVVLSGGTDISLQSVMRLDFCILKDLNADVVLSGVTDIAFQSVMNCDVCIRKDLNAERRAVRCHGHYFPERHEL